MITTKGVDMKGCIKTGKRMYEECECIMNYRLSVISFELHDREYFSFLSTTEKHREG